ncbi:hypothetical protein VNI00_004187, partial [Paramarasmius palmivorus]
MNTNNNVSISQLPIEILLRIFWHCTTWQRKNHAHLANPTNIEWLHFSHVCRSWRVASLNEPRLWNFPIFRAPKLAEEMLRRSKSAALELAFPGNDPRGLPLLFEQMDRIGSLTLVSMKTSELKILSTRLSCKDAKALHSLTITGYRSEKPYTFSADFLRNGTPVLTNLYLDRSILAWDSPLFRGLRSFTFISDSGGYRPTEMQLLGALMGMRSIETLHLVDALPEVLDSTISKIIHLPNLIHLDITDESFRCFHFLDHISLSSATKVAMTCRTNSHGNNHAHSLFNQLPRIVAYVSSRCRRLEAVKGLTIDCRGPVFDSSGVYGRKIDLTIACYSSVQGEILAYPCLDPDFKLCMELAFRYNDSVGEVVESLLGAVPLAEVAALR